MAKNLLRIISGAALWLLLCFSVQAADKIAIAEPIAKGGVKPAEVEGVWDILEASFVSDKYELVSRSALKTMLTEIGLVESSGLVDLSSEQSAQLGKLKGVKYILVPTITRFGSQYNLLIRVIDASTGVIDQKRSANLRVTDFDEMADRIEPVLAQVLSDSKSRAVSALMLPVVRCKAPSFFAETYGSHLESTLMTNGVPLQNLQSVSRILSQNGLGDLNELEPKLYVKIGKLLEVEHLISTVITRFEIVQTQRYIAASNRTVVNVTGNVAGTLYVISATTGMKEATLPMETKVDFRYLEEDTTEWTLEDYQRALIRYSISPEMLAAVLQIPGIRGNK